jgi:hypothetical protein
MARNLTDPLEPISPLRPLRPAGAPGSQRRPRPFQHPDHQESPEQNPEEGSETYDAEGHVHAPQHHKVDLED